MRATYTNTFLLAASPGPILPNPQSAKNAPFCIVDKGQQDAISPINISRSFEGYQECPGVDAGVCRIQASGRKQLCSSTTFNQKCV